MRKAGWHHTNETIKKFVDARKTRPNNWKGGKINRRGYRALKIHGCLCSDKTGYILEHRYIAYKILGRCLKRNESVHHIDGEKANNLNTNLLICTNKYHTWLESEMARLFKKEKFGGDAKCLSCIQRTLNSF